MRLSRSRFFYPLLWAVLFVVPASAQDIDALVEESQMMILESMVDEMYPGVSIAVSLGGEVVWAEGFGYADLENQVPVTTDSEFRIGSVSKPFTAAAVGQLVSAGRLDVDAPVQEYVPSFPQKRWTVTTRQVGGHIAGIRHYLGMENFSKVHYETVLDGLAIFQDSPLLFEPGTEYSYSSYGWNLISAVVEGASGERFLDYMDEHVFGALGMTNTEADFANRDIENRVSFYVKNADGKIELGPEVDNSYKWAGGGFLSTPLDMIKFAEAHLGDAFLDAQARMLLFTSQRTADGEETGYGFGWGISEDEKGRLLLGHTGGSVGGTTLMSMNPDHDIIVALTINLSRANLAVGRRIMQLFLDAYSE